jgi:hypothetical protein
VTHAYNLSYLGGEDHDERDSRPTQTMAGCGSTHLTSQLLGKAQIGGLQSRTA